MVEIVTDVNTGYRLVCGYSGPLVSGRESVAPAIVRTGTGLERPERTGGNERTKNIRIRGNPMH